MKELPPAAAPGCPTPVLAVPPQTNAQQGETTGIFREPNGVVNITPPDSDRSYMIYPPGTAPAGIDPPPGAGETIAVITEADGSTRRATTDDMDRMRADVAQMAQTGQASQAMIDGAQQAIATVTPAPASSADRQAVQPRRYHGTAPLDILPGPFPDVRPKVTPQGTGAGGPSEPALAADGTGDAGGAAALDDPGNIEGATVPSYGSWNIVFHEGAEPSLQSTETQEVRLVGLSEAQDAITRLQSQEQTPRTIRMIQSLNALIDHLNEVAGNPRDR